MLNHVTIMGRLTADPELRTTQSGVSVASFRLAVDRDYASKDGEKETDFINVVAWRQTADFVSKWFSKGRMAVISGRLQVRSYEDKKGEKRYVSEVVAENVYFGDSKKETDDSAKGSTKSSGASKHESPASVPPSSDGFIDVEDDDLPF